jgi:hypothetical protein
MASINASDYSGNRKQHAFNNTSNGYAMPGAYAQHSASQASALRAAPYMSTGNPMVQNGHPDAANMAALAHGFGAMNIANNYAGGRGSGSQMSAAGTEYSLNGYGAQPGMFVAQQPFLFMPNASGNSPSGGMYTSVPPHMQPMHSAGYVNSADNSPHGQSWTPRISSDGSSAPGMPTLITPRRGSMSSNEEHIPATPFTLQGSYNNGVAVMDRSPSGMYGQSNTPSPLQYMQPFPSMHKFSPATTTPVRIQMLVAEDPPIPRAIPAPSSPMKPLDRCLENKTGETNVYIRGLLPETTDEMLHVWGTRFGDIQSSKSIIDLKTSLCKG